MKKLIIKIVLYLSALITVLTIIFLLPRKIINASASFKLDTSIKNVIIGNSYPANAYNTEFIDSTINIANTGEIFFYSYFKLEKILNDNEEQIKNVFIEFSNNSILYNQDERIWGDILLERYKMYSSFIPLIEQKIFVSNSPSSYFKNYIPAAIKYNIGLLFKNNTERIKILGGYNYVDSTININTVKKELNFIAKEIIESDSLPKYNLEYFSKMIELCKKHQVNVFILRSPKNRNWNVLKNEDKFIEFLKLNYNDIEFLDLKNFPLTNTEMMDYSHLNAKGAEKVSKWFNKYINSYPRLSDKKKGQIDLQSNE